MDYPAFWRFSSFAVVGASSRKKFPLLTYGKLKQSGKLVYAVDATVEEIDGDRAFDDFVSLPQVVEAAVLETPPEETAAWVALAAGAGVKNIWIHQRCQTPEALQLAEQRGLDCWHGTCAVMYLSHGFSLHALHGGINKLLGKY